MRVLSVIVIGAALAASAPAAELYEPAGEPFVPIAASGRAQAQIVVPAKPTFLEEYAASELQAYLEKISAARLPIADPSQADRQAFAFFLGNTEQAERLGIQTDEQTLGRDGFVLRSVPGGLVVIGINDLGTLFGVYAFDRRQHHHLCEFCASYELWFLETQYEETDDVADDEYKRDELNEMILAGDRDTEPVSYMHRKEIDPLFLRGSRCRPGWLPTSDKGGGYRVRGITAVTWDGVMDEINEFRCNGSL